MDSQQDGRIAMIGLFPMSCREGGTMHLKRRYSNRDITLFSWTVLPLALYVLFFLVPIIMGIRYSFTDWNGLSPKFQFIGFKNFSTLFTNKRTLNSILFTGRYALLLVICVMLLAMLLTVALTYVVSARWRTAFRSIIFFPAVLSLITVGLTWNQIFYQVIPQLGHAIGSQLLSNNLLGDPKTAIWGVLLVNIWQGTAIPFVILLAGIQNVPKDLYEAARIDGAGPMKLFSKITIPFMIPTINVAFVMVLKSGITVFDYIQAMTNGGPMRSTESASVLIYELAFQDGRAGYASAYAVFMLLVIAVISWIQMKVSSKMEVGQL